MKGVSPLNNDIMMLLLPEVVPFSDFSVFAAGQLQVVPYSNVVVPVCLPQVSPEVVPYNNVVVPVCLPQVSPEVVPYSNVVVPVCLPQVSSKVVPYNNVVVPVCLPQVSPASARWTLST